MEVISPNDNETYSTVIREAFGPDKPAPYYVKTKDGMILRNKWVVEQYNGTPLMNGYTPVIYIVHNWINAICGKDESYRYSTLDYEHTCVPQFAHKHSAIQAARGKASELNERDRCIEAIVKEMNSHA